MIQDKINCFDLGGTYWYAYYLRLMGNYNKKILACQYVSFSANQTKKKGTMGVAKCGSYDQSQNTTPTEWKDLWLMVKYALSGRWVQVLWLVTDEELQFESFCELFDL